MSDRSRPLVKDYMTREVETASPDDRVIDVIERIVASAEHTGYPVTERRQVKGFITARDLLLVDEQEPIFKVMTTDLIVAHPEMRITDAARVILRSGIQKLPVVDDANNLVGIISNSDVIRSHIERATPDKVTKLKETLERIHDLEFSESRRTVNIADLTPTQKRVYADELEGRQYEMKRGLAEPLVVIDVNGRLLLADGHHRVLAAKRLGIEEIDAYVIGIQDADIELGMERTARKEGLRSIDDIEIVDYAKHPLIERIKRLQ